MDKITGLVLLLIGGVLLYYGWQSHESFVSSLSTSVTGSPTSKSIWLLILGALAALAGFCTFLRRI